MDLLESCMEWGHAIPTAPDTLTTYPFADQDPFILEECPHVFFAGNQPSFATRMLTGSTSPCTNENSCTHSIVFEGLWESLSLLVVACNHLADNLGEQHIDECGSGCRSSYLLVSL